MSITSHAFGRVKLTDADARKFKNQVVYGRPKPAAEINVAEGVKLSAKIAKQGDIKMKISKPS